MSKTLEQTRSATTDLKLTTKDAHVLTFTGKGGNIPDGSGSFYDDIVVTDNFKLTDVNITLQNFVHTWVGDLIVRLRHLETDTVVELVRRPGQPHFSSSGYSNDLNGDYTFNSNNASKFEAAAAENAVVPSGTYAPLQSLSAFKNLSAAGTWRLIVTDCSAGDSGSLGSWSLNLGWG
ncbi:MAG TPA: proprotein convertase P-domain-containing protein [Waterburya sp.]|jgi:subtilisin-like proprotein convertase family protein